jgi:DNA-binding transcriptional ArsR family regulator
MKESQAIDALSALAPEIRHKIVRHLITCGGEGASAGAIGLAVDAAPSKVSFHIATLERAGLATAEKVSRQIIYRIDFRNMGALLAYLMTDCCAGDTQILSCCSPASETKNSNGK